MAVDLVTAASCFLGTVAYFASVRLRNWSDPAPTLRCPTLNAHAASECAPRSCRFNAGGMDR